VSWENITNGRKEPKCNSPIKLYIVGWGEMRFRELEEVEEQRGEFPCTIVNFVDDDLICAWPMKKFEEELRKFSEKYEEWQDQEIRKNMEEEAKIFSKGDDLTP